MIRASLVSLLTTLLLSVSHALAQDSKVVPPPDPRNIDGSAFGESIDLSSAWLFSPTDQPGNASPTLDDSRWITLTPDQMLHYDFHQLPIGWFRIHVHLPAGARNVVFQMDDTYGEYQAFANGVQIAGPATLHGISGTVTLVPRSYRVPQSALQLSGGELVLALRVGATQHYGNYQGPYIHWLLLVSSSAAPKDASWYVTHNVLSNGINGAFALLVSFVALALYLAMRSWLEYLGAAVVLLLFSALEVSNFILFTRSLNRTVFEIVTTIMSAALTVASIEFVRLVLSKRLNRLIVLIEAGVFLALLAFSLVIFAVGYKYSNNLWLAVLFYGPVIVADVLQLALLIPACRARDVDALVLLPLLCVSFLDDFWRLCVSACSQLPHPIHLGELPSLHLASYIFSFNKLASLFFCTGILLFLVLRAVRIARERARVAAEIEAAQTMQQLLLARASEPTPGFDVESVYLPASEVGGDFFLVSPAPHDGSLTAIVGDVSGKGLSAAMRVSMILGVLRREDSRQPATILFRLNQALHSQGGVGFTTACCVRLQADGSFVVANAGHISPYVNGIEVETSPGLPLGLTTEQEYQEHVGQLGSGGRIVLMSDGVVEARKKTGELYGFDRLSSLTRRSAQEIAASAQAFGQDDDITVLTLACTA